MDATVKLTSALEVVAHTANLNREALVYFRDSNPRIHYANDLTEILDALDAWRDAATSFVAHVANGTDKSPIGETDRPRESCGFICDCPSTLHHDMSELLSKLRHAPISISRVEIINELDEALTRSREND